MKSKLIIAFITCTTFLLSCSQGNRQELEEGDLDDKAEKSEAVNDQIDSPNAHHVGHGTTQDGFNPLQGPIEPFNAPDGLEVHGFISEISEDAPYILLCHQAGFSKGEYNETTFWFNEIGFNTLAIDQRSGGEVNGIANETAQNAEKLDSNITYLDAEQDIRAAIEHIADLLLLYDREKPIYLVGSSYSASLVLKIAADTDFRYHDQIKGVAAFSPGEYLKDLELKPLLGTIDCPVFLTAAQSEMSDVRTLSEYIPDEQLTIYEPSGEGIHGSRALWPTTEGHEEIREALITFFKNSGV